MKGDRVWVTQVENGFHIELNPYSCDKSKQRAEFVAKDVKELHEILDKIFPEPRPGE